MKKCLRAAALALLLLGAACDDVGQMSNAPAEMEEEFLGANMIAAGGGSSDRVWCEVLEQQIPREDCQALSQAAQVTDGSAAFNVPDPMKRGEHIEVQLIVDRRTPLVIEALDLAAEAGNAMDGGNMAEGGNMTVAGNDVAPAGNESGAVEIDDPGANAVDATAGGIENPTPRQQTDELPGRTDSFNLRVGRRMRADLTGQGFTIIRTSPAVQQIPRNGQGTWSWEVVALQSGPKTLTLTTIVEAEVNGRVYQLQQTKHLRTVEVGVSLGDRVKDGLRGLPEWFQLLAAALTGLAGVAGAWWLVKRNWRSGPGGGAAPPSGGADSGGPA